MDKNIESILLSIKTSLVDKHDYNLIVGAIFAASISVFSGNNILWNILHFFLNWMYVAYKFAELFFKQT